MEDINGTALAVGDIIKVQLPAYPTSVDILGRIWIEYRTGEVRIVVVKTAGTYNRGRVLDIKANTSLRVTDYPETVLALLS